MRRVWLGLVSLVVRVRPPAAHAAVTQPPPPFDPSPLDGESYYLVNQASGLQARDGGSVGPRSFSDLGQRWALTKLPSGRWKISNEGGGRCLDSRAGDVVQTACARDAATQEWTFAYVTNGYSTVTNAATQLLLDVRDGRLATAAPGGGQYSCGCCAPRSSAATTRACSPRPRPTACSPTTPTRRGGMT